MSFYCKEILCHLSDYGNATTLSHLKGEEPRKPHLDSSISSSSHAGEDQYKQRRIHSDMKTTTTTSSTNQGKINSNDSFRTQ